MTPIWHIELFGGLRGRSAGGTQFAPSVSRAGALFACLALAPHRSQSREYLATLLWPEADEGAGRARLRHELSVLRRQLEPEGVQEGSVISAERDRISLITGAVVTDVERFLAALAQARACGEPYEREPLLTEAVALYGGKLLPGFDYDGIEAERVHLSHGYETALRDLAAIRQELGNYSGAETSLRSLIACNPFLEEAHTDLMRLYAGQGQPTRVREQYRQLEQMLRSEFDAEPSEQARLLMEGLSRKGAVAAPLSPVVGGSRASAPNSDTPSIANGVQPFSPSANGFDGEHLPSAAATAFPVARAVRRSRPFPWRSAVLALLTILGFAGFLVHSHRTLDMRKAGLAAPSGSAGTSGNTIRWADPTWVYAYTPQAGELANSDPRAAVLVGENLFVTGFEQTQSEDTDILTLKISPTGKLLARDRYSGPAHDCDRAFSIVADTQGGVYVAGESYVPARPGAADGWHAVVIRYDVNLNRIWLRQSLIVTKEAGDSGVQVAANAKGGCWVGGTALVNGAPHLLVQRYDSAGNLLWSRTADHESSFGRMAARGDAICTCGTRVRRDNLGLHDEWVAASFSQDGSPIWERAIEGPGLGGVAADMECEQTELFIVGTFHLASSSPGGSGVTLGAARIGADSGDLVWTKWVPQGYPEVSCGGTANGDNGVVVVGQCTMPDTSVQVETVRYNSAGDELWDRQITAPTGYRAVIGAHNHSRAILGLAAIKAEPLGLRGGDLLVTDERGHGINVYPLVQRLIGADINIPHAIQMIDYAHGYVISQTLLSAGPTLTVTRFER